MAEMHELLIAIRNNLVKRGFWLESGKIEIEGETWSYKFQKVKNKKKVIDVSDYVTKGLKEPKQEEKT
jgi:hypothetical protein